MDRMASNNCKQLLDCISDIYQTVDDPTHWQAVLQRLSETVSGGKAAITIRDNKLGHIDLLDVQNTKHFGFSNQYIEKVYSDEINLVNNWTDIEWKHELGELCIYHKHLPVNELKKTEFYKQWLEPQGLTDAVALQIFKNEYFRIVLTIKHNEAEDSEVLLNLYKDLKVLSPHLCQATAIWMALSGITHNYSIERYKGRTDYLIERYKLSKRELEVASALVRLSTIKKVANSLHVSQDTIKSHIKSVKKKMGLKTSHEMMLRLFSFNDDTQVENQNEHC